MRFMVDFHLRIFRHLVYFRLGKLSGLFVYLSYIYIIILHIFQIMEDCSNDLTNSVTNEAVKEKKRYKEKAEEMARQQLQDIWWLLYLEDHNWSVIPAVHSGIQMELYDRTKVERGQTIEIKLMKERHPNRKDNMWSGVVTAIGFKEYIKKCYQKIVEAYERGKLNVNNRGNEMLASDRRIPGQLQTPVPSRISRHGER